VPPRSPGRSPGTASGSANRPEPGRYDLAVVLDQAADGAHIILAMLIVGFVFLGVIGIGEFVRFATHRRRSRRPRAF
jgi:hypothetical protein